MPDPFTSFNILYEKFKRERRSLDHYRHVIFRDGRLRKDMEKGYHNC